MRSSFILPSLSSLLLAGALVLTGCAGSDTNEAAVADSTAVEPVVGAAVALNANLATLEELAALAPVGPDLAQAIVAGRPYATLSQLHAVVGAVIPEEGLDAVYSAVFLPINLNTASDEEIHMVPGVGDRMAHEFVEYRPYVSIAQFKREMGKYVDDAEVERLASFVFVPIDLNTASDEEILAIPGVGNRLLGEFKEYRPYVDIAQFRRAIGKYVDDNELARLERYVEIRPGN